MQTDPTRTVARTEHLVFWSRLGRRFWIGDLGGTDDRALRGAPSDPRAEELFGFLFRLEIYAPRAKREYGSFVMPILHGDRLVGRLEPRPRPEREPVAGAGVFAEAGAPALAWPAIRKQLDDLAARVGADRIELPELPSVWR